MATGAAAAKAVLPGLVEKAAARQIRFPKHWDETTKKQNVLSVLLACHNDEGGYDGDACLAQLEERYGLEGAAAEGKKRAAESAAEAAEGEDGDEEEGDEEGGDGTKKKKRAKKASDKPKLTETFANEANREMGKLIKEIADEYFTLKDAMRGSVYSKAAKAIREHPDAITSGKEAQKLKGIGKGVAGQIDEFLQTGMIQKLEKLRSGEAV